MPLDQVRISCLGRYAPVDVFDTSLFDTLRQTTAHCDANESLHQQMARVDPQVSSSSSRSIQTNRQRRSVEICEQLRRSQIITETIKVELPPLATTDDGCRLTVVELQV